MAEQPKARGVPKPVRESLADRAPWKPAPWQPADAGALQALVRGDCPAHLQQRVVAFIVNDLCGTYDLPYRPGGDEGDRDTDFACGKMWVGQQIVKLLKVRINREGEQP
jgi:hypothetical protein